MSATRQGGPNIAPVGYELLTLAALAQRLSQPGAPIGAGWVFNHARDLGGRKLGGRWAFPLDVFHRAQRVLTRPSVYVRVGGPGRPKLTPRRLASYRKVAEDVAAGKDPEVVGQIWGITRVRVAQIVVWVREYEATQKN